MITKHVVKNIKREDDATELDTLRGLYGSETYKILENETTKLWWLSPLAIATICDVKMKTGSPMNSVYIGGED